MIYVIKFLTYFLVYLLSVIVYHFLDKNYQKWRDQKQKKKQLQHDISCLTLDGLCEYDCSGYISLTWDQVEKVCNDEGITITPIQYSLNGEYFEINNFEEAQQFFIRFRNQKERDKKLTDLLK